MGGIITSLGADERKLEVDGLSIGGRRVADMTGAELHRIMKPNFPNIDPKMGHSALVQVLGAYFERVALDAQKAAADALAGDVTG
jgi:hypothetical protein